MQKKRSRNFLLDLLLYVLIAVALVTGVILWAVIVPERFWPKRAWFTFIVMTLSLAVALARFYWPDRKRMKVWLALGLLMAVHVAAYTMILQHVTDVPGAWYLLSWPLELMGIMGIVYWWTKALPRKVDF